jgi:hypothetical protein
MSKCSFPCCFVWSLLASSLPATSANRTSEFEFAVYFWCYMETYDFLIYQGEISGYWDDFFMSRPQEVIIFEAFPVATHCNLGFPQLLPNQICRVNVSLLDGKLTRCMVCLSKTSIPGCPFFSWVEDPALLTFLARYFFVTGLPFGSA